MLLDPQRADDTNAWLQKARDDLRAAQADFGADPPLLKDVAFHCQQAAERALKGFLTWHDHPFRRTHDLAEVGMQCAGLDGTLEPLCRRAEPLTVYAWIFRYPGVSEDISREEAEEAFEIAREVYEAVLARVPDGIRP